MAQNHNKKPTPGGDLAPESVPALGSRISPDGTHCWVPQLYKRSTSSPLYGKTPKKSPLDYIPSYLPRDTPSKTPARPPPGKKSGLYGPKMVLSPEMELIIEELLNLEGGMLDEEPRMPETIDTHPVLDEILRPHYALINPIINAPNTMRNAMYILDVFDAEIDEFENVISVGTATLSPPLSVEAQETILRMDPNLRVIIESPEPGDIIIVQIALTSPVIMSPDYNTLEKAPPTTPLPELKSPGEPDYGVSTEKHLVFLTLGSRKPEDYGPPPVSDNEPAITELNSETEVTLSADG